MLALLSFDTRCFSTTFYKLPSLTCFCWFIFREFFLCTFELFVFELPVVWGLDGDSGGRAMLENSFGASLMLLDFFLRACALM